MLPWPLTPGPPSELHYTYTDQLLFYLTVQAHKQPKLEQSWTITGSHSGYGMVPYFFQFNHSVSVALYLPELRLKKVILVNAAHAVVHFMMHFYPACMRKE